MIKNRIVLICLLFFSMGLIYCSRLGSPDYPDLDQGEPAGSLSDIDGNIYETVMIGTQVWMAENLRVTRYNNGDSIPNVTHDREWSTLTSGAYCSFVNNENHVSTYGRLYNWYAATDQRKIAPSGWHVPTDAEWQTLIDYLGGENTAGGKMKEVGTTHWRSPNTGATNESGFSARGSEVRNDNGSFGTLGAACYLWSTTESNSNRAWDRTLVCNGASAIRDGVPKLDGLGIRCIKD